MYICGICFSSNAATDTNNFLRGTPFIAIQPEPRDFFIFPAAMQHQVYPFRTPDGKGERRSVSFNATVNSQFMQEEENKNKRQKTI